MKIEVIMEKDKTEWQNVSEFPNYTFGIFSDNYKGDNSELWVIYKSEKYLHFIDKEWVRNKEVEIELFTTSRIRKLRRGEQIKISGE